MFQVELRPRVPLCVSVFTFSLASSRGAPQEALLVSVGGRTRLGCSWEGRGGIDAGCLETNPGSSWNWKGGIDAEGLDVSRNGSMIIGNGEGGEAGAGGEVEVVRTH